MFLCTFQVSPTPPAFNLTGPSEVMKGTAGSWRLEMTFYNAATDVILDVYAPVNDTAIMSICRVSVLQTGKHLPIVISIYGFTT